MTSLSAYELYDLQHVMMERMSDCLLPAITAANRTGDLANLLSLLGMGDLIADESVSFQPTRVVVLGDSMVNESKLRSIVRKNGYDPEQFDFVLGYNELKHFNFGKLRDSYTYRAVMVGPMPHSTPGKYDSSSAVTEMKAHPELYPPVIELRDSTGLKITNNSFAQGLTKLV